MSSRKGTLGTLEKLLAIAEYVCLIAAAVVAVFFGMRAGAIALLLLFVAYGIANLLVDFDSRE